MEGLTKVFLVAALTPVIIGFALLMTALLDLLLAWPLMLCWNHVVPQLFGLPQIGYWQAFCLLIVATLLIKAQPASSPGK